MVLRHPKEHCNNGLKSVVTIFIKATPLQELTLVSIPENFPATLFRITEKKQKANPALSAITSLPTDHGPGFTGYNRLHFKKT
jgi:hypothetical protein